MSHIRGKFGLPIWLTEFNCGNGWWNCPLSVVNYLLSKTLKKRKYAYSLELNIFKSDWYAHFLPI